MTTIIPKHKLEELGYHSLIGDNIDEITYIVEISLADYLSRLAESADSEGRIWAETIHEQIKKIRSSHDHAIK